MNVVVVYNYALPHVGGVDVLVDREVRMLAAAGHRVKLVTSSCGAGSPPGYPENVEVVGVPAWNLLERLLDIPWPIFSPQLLFALWNAVRWGEIVHVHGFLGLNSFVALCFARLFRESRPSVLTEHAGRRWYGSVWKRTLQDCAIYSLGRINVRLARECHGCHPRVLRLLSELGGPGKHISRVMFPPDRHLFRPPTAEERRRARAELGWEPGRPKVLFVGRLGHLKGVDLLLSASDERYDLVFCGPGDRSLLGGIDGRRVEYFTALPQRELVRLYQSANVLALPSRSEGNFVLVAQEAIACGLPVLLGDDPGLAEYRGCPGLHFCSLAPEAIRAALHSILDVTTPPLCGGYDALLEFLPSDDEWISRLLTVTQNPCQRLAVNSRSS